MDSKLSDDEEPEGQKAKAKENEGLENEGKGFLTQRFVHGGQTRVDGGESQRKSLKKF